jgi:hypothetical protein
VRETVLRELQPALADEAVRLMRDRLQPAVERVLSSVTMELRKSFETRLRESIARAVAAELRREREER